MRMYQDVPKDLKAAVVLSNGLMYLGCMHGECFYFASKDLGDDMLWNDMIEGFYCAELGFLDRMESLDAFTSGESIQLARMRGSVSTASGLGGSAEGSSNADIGWTMQYKAM